MSGRPAKYQPEFAAQAEKLCLLGATDAEIADFFEVDVRTIHRWKVDYDEFCHSLKAGKEKADERVERSLYQRAIGYKHDAVKIFMPANAQEPVYAPYIEHHAPDTTACIFWLKNRRSGDWRDKVTQEHQNPDGTPIQAGGPTIIFSGAPPNTSAPEAMGMPRKSGD